MSNFLISRQPLPPSRRTALASLRIGEQIGVRVRSAGGFASSAFLLSETVAFASRRCSA